MKSLQPPRWFSLFAALAFPAGAFAQDGFEWKPAEIEGRDYLPVDQISRFYGLEKPGRFEKEIILENRLVKVVFEVDSWNCFMNGVKFVFHKPVREVNGVAHVSRDDLALVLDPVLRPNHIKDAGDFKTVILDPAHGGEARGTASKLGSAAEYSLAVAKLTAKRLKERGYQVVLTREEDMDRSLQQRLDFANAVEGNAIFISIDFGSGPKDKRGIETRTLAQADREAVKMGAADFGSSSIALATAVHSSGLRHLGENTADSGIRRSRYAVFSKIKHPAIEFKGGFLTHEDESKLIHNETYQSALAAGIVTGIEKYRFAVRRKKP